MRVRLRLERTEIFFFLVSLTLNLDIQFLDAGLALPLALSPALRLDQKRRRNRRS